MPNSSSSSSTKDAEVRARVPEQMYSDLQEIASARGEQLPVIVREALAQYLAKRVAGYASDSQQSALVNVLQDKPQVVQALLDLAHAVSNPVSYGPSPKAAAASQMDSETQIVGILKGKYGKKKKPPGSPPGKK